ncbi:MAG: ribonuclease P protein component [Cyanobacteria bacterium]|nr:ribonuclease P protein component [Cyanobacteriota bacterium]
MLPRSKRIKKSLFPLILSQGLSFSYFFFNLKLSKSNPALPSSQFAFVISSKVSSKAVERNRLRRRAHSVIERHLQEVKNGYFLVFFFKKEALKLNFEELEKEMLKSLKQAKVYYV